MSFTKVHLLAVSPRVSPSFESKSTGTSMVFLSCNHSFSTKITVSCAYICNLLKWSLISLYMMKFDIIPWVNSIFKLYLYLSPHTPEIPRILQRISFHFGSSCIHLICVSISLFFQLGSFVSKTLRFSIKDYQFLAIMLLMIDEDCAYLIITLKVLWCVLNIFVD